ncbi:hypothetical protein [Actinorugispora endophytica]|uniref:Uncharacterized protein n=1 Tax=Actinorugispora endophytica TaxID=1605990 RepID=A0A4R6UDL3_9ACTN|nr:hypothetical protein [Actinorugispora endophytica]TDQ44172.1 hypothetical protein EV190_1379 [Actinorugispora endophytica]
MRHFFGLIIGLLLAPVVLLGSGWVLPRVTALAGSGGTFLGVGGLATLGTLGVLALVLALVLVPPRLTPLVPGVAGLGLAGFTAVHLLRPGLVDLVPGSVLVPGLPGAVVLLESGLYLPLALAMLVPVFWPSRWRSYRPRGAHAFNDDDYEDDEEEGGFAADAAARGAA